MNGASLVALVCKRLTHATPKPCRHYTTAAAIGGNAEMKKAPEGAGCGLGAHPNNFQQITKAVHEPVRLGFARIVRAGDVLAVCQAPGRDRPERLGALAGTGAGEQLDQTRLGQLLVELGRGHTHPMVLEQLGGRRCW